MKKIILYLLYLMVVCISCTERSNRFSVTGHIENASDSMLYFEHLAIDGLRCIDSLQLDKKGAFTFYDQRPLCPEFYRLRINNQVINLSVDSTEVLTIKGSMPQLSLNYTVEGAKNCTDIQNLSRKLVELQQDVVAVSANTNLTVSERESEAKRLIDEYKNHIKVNYILRNPSSAASYFALFQSIGSTLLFNPVSNWNDVRFIMAVGTAWDEKYPEAERTQNLHNIAIQGMKNSRPKRQWELEIDSSKIQNTGIIDIDLRDIQGTDRRLSDLKGKVVMLDFTAYSSPNSKERIMQMRELYETYRHRGFEIYQVSFDPNEHYWKTSCQNLPWICVFDPEGIRSINVGLYQLRTLPSYFLIDRNCELKARSENIPNLKKAIEELL
mgnify:CR=1 FL=1